MALLAVAAPMALSLAALPARAQINVPTTTPPFAVSAGTIGSVVTSGDGLTTTITQTSQRAVLDWQQLSVASGKTLVFSQPNAGAITLNRVATGGQGTLIDGTISANGKVWILNPSGLFIGTGGRITTAGFLASTGSIKIADFMAAANQLTITGVTDSNIFNQGQIIINAAAGTGYAVLAGTRVQNGQSFVSGVTTTGAGSALIAAELNRIALGSGNAFTLDFAGDGLINFAVAQNLTSQQIGGGIFNNGTLSAAGGTIVMTGRAAAEAVGAVINTNGMVMAQKVGIRSGQIVLDAGPGGRIAAGGTIMAQGLAEGQIRFTGNVELTGPTLIDTDGTLLMQGNVTAAPTTGTFGSALSSGTPLASQNIGLGSNAVTVDTVNVTSTSSSSSTSSTSSTTTTSTTSTTLTSSATSPFSIRAGQLTAGSIALPSAPVSLEILNTGTISGAVASVSLGKSGPGVLRLDGASNTLGELVIKDGVLVTGNIANIAKTPIIISGGTLRAESAVAATLSNPITVRSSGEIELQGAADWTVISAIDAAKSAVGDTELTITAQAGLTLNGVIGSTGKLTSFLSKSAGRLRLGPDAQIKTTGLIGLAGKAGFINDATASLPLDPGESNWLVWSGNANPFSATTGDKPGALAYQFRHYNISEAQVEGGAPPPEILPDANGFLYAIAPVLSLTSSAPVTKVYDGTDAGSLPVDQVGLTGAINGDLATISISSGGVRFDRSDVLATKLLIPEFSITVRDSAGRSVLGYSVPQLVGGGLPGTITPRPLAVGLIGVVERVYDGSSSALLTDGNLSITGLVSGERITVTKTAATLASANVGSNITTVLTLGAADFAAAQGTLLSNYVLPTSATGKIGNVTPRALTVALIGSVQRSYDGTTTAALSASNFGFSGLATGESISVTQAQGRFASANTGNGLLVSATLGGSNFAAGTGTLLSNYSLPQSVSAAIGSITPLTLLYVAETATRTVGQVDPLFKGSITGFIAGETVASATTGTLVFGTTATDKSPAGPYPINGSGLTATNYVFAQAPTNDSALTITSNVVSTITAAISSVNSSVTTTVAAIPSLATATATVTAPATVTATAPATTTAPAQAPAQATAPAQAPATAPSEPAAALPASGRAPAPAPAPAQVAASSPPELPPLDAAPAPALAPVAEAARPGLVAIVAPPVEPSPPSPVPAEPYPVPPDAEDAGDPVLQLAEQGPASRTDTTAPRAVQIAPNIMLETGSLIPPLAVDALSYSVFVTVGY